MNMLRKLLITLFLMIIPILSLSWVRGIYVTQPVLEQTRMLKYLIAESRALGINTFVIDYWGSSKRTRANIQLVKDAGIHYVARIVMFPKGATSEQVHSPQYLAKRFKLIQQAVDLGADRVQLDYIRYSIKQHMSDKNVQDINQVIREVRNQLRGKGVGLEIDIFGEVAHLHSKAIGQDVPVMAASVDAVNPMVYPSHYFPYSYHSQRPYETVYKSLISIRDRLKQHPDVKVYAFIEMHNIRYPMSRASKLKYIGAELRAVRDANANGWYAWSATNKYRNLFDVLRSGNFEH